MSFAVAIDRALREAEAWEAEQGIHCYTWEELQERVAFDTPLEWITPPAGINDAPPERKIYTETELLARFDALITDEWVLGRMLRGYDLGLEDGKGTTQAGLYTMIPTHLVRSANLTHTQKMVLIEFMSFAWGKNFAYPSIATVAEDLRMKRNTIASALQELVLQGYLEKRSRPGRTNTYKPSVRKIWGGHKFTGGEWQEQEECAL